MIALINVFLVFVGFRSRICAIFLSGISLLVFYIPENCYADVGHDDYDFMRTFRFHWRDPHLKHGLVRDSNGKETVLFLSHVTVGFAPPDEPHMPPLYKLYVYSDGTVEFEGAKNTVRIAHGSRDLDPNAYHKLLNVIESQARSGNLSYRTYGDAFGAVVAISSDDGLVRQYFGSADMNVYANFRRQIEPYVDTYSFRCPLDNPIFEYGYVPATVLAPLPRVINRMDVCHGKFEFDDILN